MVRVGGDRPERLEQVDGHLADLVARDHDHGVLPAGAVGEADADGKLHRVAFLLQAEQELRPLYLVADSGGRDAGAEDPGVEER